MTYQKNFIMKDRTYSPTGTKMIKITYKDDSEKIMTNDEWVRSLPEETTTYEEFIQSMRDEIYKSMGISKVELYSKVDKNGK